MAKRETQLLRGHEIIVYEAIATRHRPMTLDEVTAVTGLPEPTVRPALDRLIELQMIEASRERTFRHRSGIERYALGPHDWDVRGGR